MDNSEESVEEIELVEQEEIEVEEDVEDDSDEDTNKKDSQKKINKETQNEISGKNEKKENLITNKEINKATQTQKFNDIINQSKEIDILINESNIDIKVKGYIKLRELFENSDSTIIYKNFDLFFAYIQDKLKNFHEANLAILNEGIKCICALFKVVKEIDDDPKIDKKYLYVLLNELYEKIIIPKIKNSYIELLNLLIDVFSGLIVFDVLFQILSEVDKISILKEYAIFIKNYLNNINLKTLTQKINTKNLVEFSINIMDNENPQIKNISTEIITIIYDYIDDSLKKYIKNNNIKIPIINNTNDKKQVQKYYITEDTNKNKEINDNINYYNDNTNNETENINSINNNTYYNPRDDISCEITNKLLKDINYGNWNEKKEGVEYIHEVLDSHGNYVLINGLNDLIELIINKITDPNKNFVRIIIELLTHLIEALGAQLKPYTKAIIEPLLNHLSNKNNLIRQECINCINKWIKKIQNFGIICSYMPQLLLNENFDMRNELLNILIVYNSLLNKNISNIFYNDISYSLLVCLQDKSSTIRCKAEKLIYNLMSFIKEDDYIKNCQKFKQAISESLEQTIKTIYKGEINVYSNKRYVIDSNNNGKTANSLNLTEHKSALNPKKKIIQKR